MLRRITCLLAALFAILMVGCASVQRQAADSPCLPPGVSSAIFGWPVLYAELTTIQTDAGRPAPGVVIYYRQGDRAVVAVWSRGRLVVVDPAPDTPQPGWVDLRFMTPDGALRAEPNGQCEWRQLGGQTANTLLPMRLKIS